MAVNTRKAAKMKKETLHTTGKVTTNINPPARDVFATLVDSITECMGWQATPACLARAIIEGVCESTAAKGLHTVLNEDDLKVKVKLWCSKGFKPLAKPKPKKQKAITRQMTLQQVFDEERKGEDGSKTTNSL